MLKIVRTIGVALFAALALGAVASSSAFAESEWLFNGSPVMGLRAELEGLIVIVSYSAGAIIEEIDCEGATAVLELLGKNAELLSVLNILNEELGDLEDTAPLALSCEVTFKGNSLDGCVTPQLMNIWFDNINVALADIWRASIVLDNATTFLFHLNATNLTGVAPGYELECKTLLGVTVSELCELLSWGVLTNNANGSVSLTGEKLAAAGERGTCSALGAEASELLISGSIWESASQLEHMAGLSVS